MANETDPMEVEGRDDEALNSPLEGDLYGDLFTYTAHGTLAKGEAVLNTEFDKLKASLEEYQRISSERGVTITELQAQLITLEEQRAKLAEEKDILLRNISCLFKTAQLEIERKETEIKTLRTTVEEGEAEIRSLRSRSSGVQHTAAAAPNTSSLLPPPPPLSKVVVETPTLAQTAAASQPLPPPPPRYSHSTSIKESAQPLPEEGELPGSSIEAAVHRGGAPAHARATASRPIEKDQGRAESGPLDAGAGNRHAHHNRADGSNAQAVEKSREKDAARASASGRVRGDRARATGRDRDGARGSDESRASGRQSAGRDSNRDRKSERRPESSKEQDKRRVREGSRDGDARGADGDRGRARPHGGERHSRADSPRKRDRDSDRDRDRAKEGQKERERSKGSMERHRGESLNPDGSRRSAASRERLGAERRASSKPRERDRSRVREGSAGRNARPQEDRRRPPTAIRTRPQGDLGDGREANHEEELCPELDDFDNFDRSSPVPSPGRTTTAAACGGNILEAMGGERVVSEHNDSEKENSAGRRLLVPCDQEK